MTDVHDPRRLRESREPAFAELYEGMEQARSRGPSLEQLARLRAGLGLPPAPAAPADRNAESSRAEVGSEVARTAKAGTRSALSHAGTWLKLVSVGSLVGILSLAVLSQRTQPVETFSEPERVASSEPAPTIVAQTKELEPAVPAAPSSADAATHVAEVVMQAKPRARRVAASVAAPLRKPPQRELPVHDPAAELGLLKRARAHVRSAPLRALALVAEHQQQFPEGVLREERDVLEIEALIVSGQRVRAEACAARFFETFPRSAHARRVRALLAEVPSTLFDKN